MPGLGHGAEIDTATSQLTHSQFIHHALTQLAEEIFARTAAGNQHCRWSVDDNAVGRRWVTTVFHELWPGAHDSLAAIACHVDTLNFSLIRKTRRGFFGSLWFQRELDVGLKIQYPPALCPAGDCALEIRRTYSGWFRAADDQRFRDGEFSGLLLPPSTDFVSRWATPVAVGTGLGVLTFLFFSVR